MLAGPHAEARLTLIMDRTPKTAGGHMFTTPKGVSVTKSNLARVRHFVCIMIINHSSKMDILEDRKVKKKIKAKRNQSLQFSFFYIILDNYSLLHFKELSSKHL